MSLELQKNMSETDSDHDSDIDSAPIVPVSTQSSQIYSNVQPEIIFYVEFLDGHSFKQYYEFYSQTLPSAPLLFTKDKIIICYGSGDNEIFVNTEIKTDNLIAYVFNPKYVSHPNGDDDLKEPYHLVNIKIREMKEAIKSISRKEGIRIIQYHGLNEIHIQPYGANVSCGHVAVKTESLAHRKNFDFSGFKQDINEPNCKLPLLSFCDACKNIGRIKDVSKAVISCYPKGVKLDATGETGITNRYAQWGYCEVQNLIKLATGGNIVIRSNNTNNVFSVGISRNNTKAFDKLSGLAKGVIMKVYCEMNGVVRLIIKFNYYSEMTIFLLDPSGQK